MSCDTCLLSRINFDRFKKTKVAQNTITKINEIISKIVSQSCIVILVVDLGLLESQIESDLTGLEYIFQGKYIEL